MYIYIYMIYLHIHMENEETNPNHQPEKYQQTLQIIQLWLIHQGLHLPRRLLKIQMKHWVTSGVIKQGLQTKARHVAQRCSI